MQTLEEKRMLTYMAFADVLTCKLLLSCILISNALVATEESKSAR